MQNVRWFYKEKHSIHFTLRKGQAKKSFRTGKAQNEGKIEKYSVKPIF